DFQQELDRRAKQGLARLSRQEFVRQAFESGTAYSELKVQKLLLRLLKDDPNSSNMYKSILGSPVDRFSYNEIAILVRASHQMRAFEDRFLTIGLPYRVIGGPRFYERMEIRDAMAYFRVAVSNENDLAFERIVNTPKRGLGDKAVQLINLTAREHNVSLLEGARILVAAGGLSTKARNALRQLVEGFERWSAAIRDGSQSHIAIAETILEESGYTDHWRNDKTVEGPGRLENLKELVKALEQFENLQGFLEHISLIMENEQEENTPKVTIMTLHAAKGLEFPAVFLPGWEDGLFPSQRSMDEAGQKGVEEERRLAYVGITRAEEVCTISFATNRRVYGQWQSAIPSRFIDELPPEHVEVLTPPGLHSGPVTISSDMADKVARADAYSSPGWKRMQARNAQYAPSIAPKPKRVIMDAEEIPDFAIGDRVAHDKYGGGTVIGVEVDKLSIVFDGGGAKKILASFVTMQDEVPF
ncbi:MAG: ATP-binding domain-containing protein, partial [Proteobacteria bacterium]|nr:ATP-binding domain-containing protein [Pseudomonadota bacterium]